MQNCFLSLESLYLDIFFECLYEAILDRGVVGIGKKCSKGRYALWQN
jgi:hypothetical protein